MNVLRRCFVQVRQVPAAVCLALLVAGQARASVAVLLEQPYGKMNLFEPAGHTAIYLDHVCAETPLKLRPCHAGELGVVLSRYDGIGNHDWVAMPLIPYLYAVSSPEQIPDTMDRAAESAMRDEYRRHYLEAIAPDRADGSTPDGNWYEFAGAAYDRTIYGFQVKTTPDQDAKLIATFNDEKNTENYNGMYRNCADFVRDTINRVYPHAVRRNYIADLWFSSPKSVARSLTHYARKHPDTDFRVFVVPQVKGSLPRSHGNTDLAEGILKRLGVPLVVLSPVTTGVVLAAYVGHGRFAMPKDAPLLDLSQCVGCSNIERPFPGEAPRFSAPVSSVTVGTASGTGVGSVALVSTGTAGLARVGLKQ